MVRSEEFLREVRNNNLTAGPVSVSRIIIKYRIGEDSRRLRANFKYDGNEKMLISIRTFAGIEAARILIERDSVKINDRINKIYYRGTEKEMNAKYGFSIGDISLFLGDIGEIERTRGKIACIEGQVKVNVGSGDAKMEYIIDCGNHKIMAVRGRTGGSKGVIKGVFKDFTKEDGLKYPTEIKWSIEDRDIEIEVEMDNVKRQDNMNFIFDEEKSYALKGLL